MFLSRNFNYSSRLLSLGTKIAVNQCLFTPIFNSYFFGMQAFLAGDNLYEVWERIKRTVPTSLMNSIKVWPIVTAINFTWIPIEVSCQNTHCRNDSSACTVSETILSRRRNTSGIIRTNIEIVSEHICRHHRRWLADISVVAEQARRGRRGQGEARWQDTTFVIEDGCSSLEQALEDGILERTGSEREYGKKGIEGVWDTR